MQTKLTLRLDEELIEQAKSYAKRCGRSVSQLVADYFSLVTSKQRRVKKQPLPITRSLRGILCHAHLDEKDYRRHLRDKYL